ncbi:MAG: CPBP family glutamic-type intramembrane protease [Candidatus Acidiferrales bacterium]
METKTLLTRFTAWIQDFLPENVIQLHFPIASLLVLIGTSSGWAPPRHMLVNLAAQLGQPDLWFDWSSHWIQAAYLAAQYAMQFAFLASIWLWSVPVRAPLRKFNRWVLLPIGLAIAVFLTMVLLGESPRISILDANSPGLHALLWRFPTRFMALGKGFYLTVVGAALLIAALRLVAAKKIHLPVRFRSQTSGQYSGAAEEPGLTRNVILFMIVASILKDFVNLFLLALSHWHLLSWVEGSANFPTFNWLIATVNAALAAVCALVFLKRNGDPWGRHIFRFARAREAAIAITVPLLIVFIPRIALGIFLQSEFNQDGVQDIPTMWGELFVPSPFPALLLVFVTAFLQEAALRGALQTRLTEAVGLKRAIFLIALIAYLLPLYWSAETYGGIRHPVIVFSSLIYIAVFLAYGVLLGWLFARTGSTAIAALAYGTLIFFHRGSGNDIYVAHPGVTWIEMACLLFAGWFLFKCYPPAQPSPERENIPAV